MSSRCRVLGALVGLATLISSCAPTPAGAGDALIVEERFNPDALAASEALAEILVGLGYEVEVRAPELGDTLDGIRDFTCAFDLRPDLRPVLFDAPVYQLYVELGGNLLLGGEHAGFDFRNRSLVDLINDLGGGLVAIDPTLPTSFFRRDLPQPLNPSHAVATECNAVTEVVYDGIDHGRVTDTARGTWVTGSPVEAATVAWDHGDLFLAPSSRLVLVLDIDFLSPLATLDFRVEDPTIPTHNRAFVANLATFLCGAPGDPTAVPCDGGAACTPRNHGPWHRFCLGSDEIAPGRRGRGGGPGPAPLHGDLGDGIVGRVDAALASHGVGACAALDEGPFSDERQAALRELATVHFNLAAGLLSRSCPVELHPVVSAEDLTVADAIRLIDERLADGSRRALREARWIGEHVVNGEALTSDRERR